MHLSSTAPHDQMRYMLEVLVDLGGLNTYVLVESTELAGFPDYVKLSE
jgi:hypothetical protein